jgi:hypothetical protein
VRNSINHSLTVDRFRWLGKALRALALTGALLAFAASTAGARPPSPDPQPFGDTTAAARPVEPYSAGFVAASPQQSTGSNPSTAQDAGIPPILHRVHSLQLAAFNAARQQALANHVPPSGHYSTADVNAYAAVKAPTVSTPGSGFDWATPRLAPLRQP